MEAIIDKAVADGTPINAVLAENDSTALGVAAALTGKNYDPYPPVSGQDGDPANLNNVAKGLQYVDVWKNANELGKAAGAAALALCAGGDMASLTLQDGLIDPAVAPAAGLTAQAVRDAGWHHASARSSSSRPRSRRRTCSWPSTVARSPRKRCAPASTPRQRRRPASNGLRPLS